MIDNLIIIILLFSAEKEAPVIHIYDGRGENKELTALTNIHNSPILFMKVYCYTLSYLLGLCFVGNKFHKFCILHEFVNKVWQMTKMAAKGEIHKILSRKYQNLDKS